MTIRQHELLSSLIVTKNDRLMLPELFYHTDIDPETRVRTRPMKVIVVGMARTGTMSIRAALEMLGIGPSYHMMSWYTNPRDGKLWKRAISAKFDPLTNEQPLTRREWDHLLGDCEGALDAPAVAFIDELVEIYPEAKVILAERNANSWARSYRETIGRSAGDWVLGRILAPLDDYFLKDHVVAVRQLFKELLGPNHLRGPPGGAEEQEMVQRYKDLHTRVRTLIPKERILEWNLEQGWEPLCKFFDVKQPDQKLPHINDKAVFARRQYLRKWLAADRILIRYVHTIILVTLALLSLFLRVR